jgi:hypothetical protein
LGKALSCHPLLLFHISRLCKGIGAISTQTTAEEIVSQFLIPYVV